MAWWSYVSKCGVVVRKDIRASYPETKKRSTFAARAEGSAGDELRLGVNTHTDQLAIHELRLAVRLIFVSV